MLKYLKNKFPDLYDRYVQLKIKGNIKEIERIKKLPFNVQIKMLEKMYERRIGHSLDWNNLQTYTEKMQWEKLYDKNPIKTELADKYRVREWIISQIGEEYLIPLLGVWDSFDEINFDVLPSRFVLKTNHGSGTNYIVKDKLTFDKIRAKELFDLWMLTDYGYKTGFELHYSGIKRKILAEQYLETEYQELQDYKFLCFSGIPYYCWVDMGRYSTHTRNVYNLEWQLQPWNQEHYDTYKEEIPKPENFSKMVKIAGILSKDFSHVRVDLYNVKGKIYFGEMTFTNGSGLDKIIPEQYDRILGNLWHIDTSVR